MGIRSAVRTFALSASILSSAALSAAILSPPAAAGGIPDAIHREIEAVLRMNEKCKGGLRVQPGATDAEMEKAEAERDAICEGRDDAIAGLKEKGWCFGKDSDVREADRVWRKCVKSGG